MGIIQKKQYKANYITYEKWRMALEMLFQCASRLADSGPNIFLVAVGGAEDSTPFRRHLIEFHSFFS
jgi:hypothetical protein